MDVYTLLFTLSSLKKFSTSKTVLIVCILPDGSLIFGNQPFNSTLFSTPSFLNEFALFHFGYGSSLTKSSAANHYP